MYTYNFYGGYNMQEIQAENFEQKVIYDNSDNLTVVDFMANWCSPCQQLKPVLEDLSNEYKDINFFKVDIDKNMDLAKKYSISSIPTVIFFKNGENIRQFFGIQNKNFIKSMIDELS